MFSSLPYLCALESLHLGAASIAKKYEEEMCQQQVRNQNAYDNAYGNNSLKTWGT
jgi:hypothetical protein